MDNMNNWSLEQLVALCDVLHKSGYFKDVKSSSQALVKILYGQELGIPAIAALRGVIVDRGTITLTAGLVSGLILRSGRYSYRVIEADAERCEVEFYAGADNRVGVEVLTIQQAKASGMHMQPKEGGGMSEKITWKNYPGDMLFARVITRGARRYCPDIFLGPVYTPDELIGTGAAEVVTPQVEEATVPALPDNGVSLDMQQLAALQSGASHDVIESPPVAYGPRLVPRAPEGATAVTTIDEYEATQRMVRSALRVALPPIALSAALKRAEKEAREEEASITVAQVGLVCAVIEAALADVAGSATPEEARHKTILWLAGNPSVRSMSPAGQAALHRWLKPQRNAAGQWVADETAQGECRAVYAVASRAADQPALV